MRVRGIWGFLAVVLLLAAGAVAQEIKPIGGDHEELPLGFEICDNGADDDGDGPADCDDPDCASDPACAEEPLLCDDVAVNEPEGFEAAVLGLTMQGPGRKGQCNAWTTDSDGRNPQAAGCLTHWSTAACGAPAVGWRWDICTNGTTLREVHTTAANKTGCQQATALDRHCGIWLDWFGNKNGLWDECPANSNPVCVTQPLNCGGAVEQVGVCGCAVPPPPPPPAPVPATDKGCGSRCPDPWG